MTRKKSCMTKASPVKTIARFKTANYRTPTQIGDFTITMRDAGHILGSASLEIEDKQADSKFRKIVFSGDLGNTPEDLLAETELIEGSDVVVMESTYGDSIHPSQIRQMLCNLK